jgi:hypothetical protein
MEENVGLFASNGNIGRCAFGNRIRRSGNVLLLFVLGELLIMASLVFLNFHQPFIWVGFICNRHVLTVGRLRLALGTVNCGFQLVKAGDSVLVIQTNLGVVDSFH